MRITHNTHPAKGQFGLFAAKKIPPRSYIIDYVGEVHCDDRPGSDYDLSLLRLQDGLSVGVDASTMGNEARFINDFRGIANRPNAQFQESVNTAGELCMSIWSENETIKKGDEILVSYGKGFWNARKGG
jgi:SET domain-containing protein